MEKVSMTVFPSLLVGGVIEAGGRGGVTPGEFESVRQLT